MIENTASGSSIEETALLVMATGTSDGLIERQERVGQAQLVNSDRLPTRLNSPREEFEALGFVFGDPDPDDPLFMPATLPDGWTRQASDYDTWSYILDRVGRRRVSVYYKAAFYDRRASASLRSVWSYVSDCAAAGQQVVTDDVWATRGAVLTETARHIARISEDIARISSLPPSEHRDSDLAEFRAVQAKYEGIRAAVRAT